MFILFGGGGSKFRKMKYLFVCTLNLIIHLLNRCPNLNQIPLTCKLKYNPDDPCCPLPDCPAIIPPTPGLGSTLAPTAHPPPMPGKVQAMM